MSKESRSINYKLLIVISITRMPNNIFVVIFVFATLYLYHILSNSNNFLIIEMPNLTSKFHQPYFLVRKILITS